MMTKKLRITIPPIDAEEIISLSSVKDVKAFLMRDKDGDQVVVVIAKGVAQIMQALVSALGYFAKNLKL